MTYAQAISELAMAMGVASDAGAVASELETLSAKRASRNPPFASAFARTARAIRADERRQVVALAPIVLDFL